MIFSYKDSCKKNITYEIPFDYDFYTNIFEECRKKYDERKRIRYVKVAIPHFVLRRNNDFYIIGVGDYYVYPIM